ncbi:MAG: hypothetical protein ACRDFB_09345 [Rhabdochlamydiaceae bacterium]
MSFRILKKILDLDNNYDLHLARLLILISFLSGEKHKEIKGITKLVKLDFLLRYPTVLEKALQKFGSYKEKIMIHENEKNSVESKMVRFRYGPWDPRYYQYLAILESQGLVNAKISNKTVEITITNKGFDVASNLSGIIDLSDFVARSKIINSQFGKIGATKLKDMMYELVPELHDMRFGEVIKP